MDNIRRLIEQLNQMAEEIEQQQTGEEQSEPKTLFDNLFDNHPLFNNNFEMNASVHELLYEVIEEDEAIIVVVDLPGFSEDQISLQSDERQIRVSAEATDDMRRESVSHTFSLPVEVVPSEATATFENGVLEVTLPRVEEEDDDATTIDIS